MKTRLYALTFMASVLSLPGCGEVQMGADPDVFKAVDALYTAVSLREAAKVDHCVTTLATIRDSGRLDRGPFDALDRIASEAKSGSWESAQTRLARFMRGQTRGR